MFLVTLYHDAYSHLFDSKPVIKGMNGKKCHHNLFSSNLTFSVWLYLITAVYLTCYGYIL